MVRFFYCKSGDTEPVRALCYSTATKAWWEETFPSAITATCTASLGGQMSEIRGTAAGGIIKTTGLSDSGTAVAYQYRSGVMPLDPKSDSRSVGIVYTPTTNDALLGVSLHFNGSNTPRTNAIASDRGSGFTTAQGSTVASLNLKTSRSSLGDATGYAKAYYSGRVDDRSSGGDRHMAIAFNGTQSADPIVVHGVLVEGAG